MSDGAPLARLAQRVWSTPARWIANTPRNEQLIYQEVTFQAIIEAGAMSFMAVFLVRLGAPNLLVGLYTALPALVAIFVALPIGSFVQGQGNLIKVANWSRLMFRSTVGAFALLPFLPLGIAPLVLVGARALIELPAEASNIAFTTILGMVTPAETRPRMLSTRLMVNGFVGAAVGFLAGQWLDFAPFPWNYQLLFLTSFFSGLLSIYTLSRLQLPATAPHVVRSRPAVGLRDIPRLIREVPAFRNFTFAALIFRLSMAMPSALYSIYRVRTLGASDAWIGSLLTIERAMSVVSYFVLARFLIRARNKRWLWLGCVGMAAYPLFTALATTPEMLILPAMVGGVFGAMMNVYMSNTLFAVSPEDRRPTFVAANACLASVSNFIAPLIGTWLADIIGINNALLFIGAFRLVGGFSFFLLKVDHEQPAGA
jgi:hypothetical protein